MDMLVKYPWPGNVRELRTQERAGAAVRQLRFERGTTLSSMQAYEQEDDTEPSSLSVPLEGATLRMEREAILRMLDSVGDNKSRKRRGWGISRVLTSHTKLKRYGQEQD